MAESELTMILRTKQEGANVTEEAVEDLNQLKDGLSNVEKAMAGTRTTIGGLDKDMTVMGQNVGAATDVMSALGVNIPISPLALMGDLMREGIEIAKESIEEYTTYGDTISRLASATSTSTEEMSKLWQVADDFRIQQGDLEMALKTMTNNGISPSIEGLAELSDQYLKIEDPLERSQFLLDNFGRAGQDMGRIMLEGSESIKAMADEVEDWMIITGKSEEQILAYKATQDKWGEAIDELKYKFAMGITPVVTSFMDAILGMNDDLEETEDAWWRWIPMLRAVETAFLGVKNLFESFKAPQLPATGSTTGSGRAQGGPVQAGVSYPVGERQVEYYTPTLPGTISPSPAGGGQTLIFNYSPVVSLADQAEAERVLAPYILQALRGV